FMSPRFKGMFGYAEDEIENTPEARDGLILEDDLPAAREAFERHVSTRGSVPYDLEKRYRHRDGSIIWVLSRGRIVEWSSDHQPLRMMGVHVDITDMKQRELAVQSGAAEIRRFAFVAAHDLVQPMNTIEGCISMLMEDYPEDLDEDQKTMMGFLTASVRRMKERIEGILDFSRLRDDALEFVPVDLNAVVSNALEDLSAQVQEADAEVTMSDLPMAAGSSRLVLRVVQNILSNALKYRHRERRCRILIEEAPAPEGMVAVRIADNGIGIQPDYRKKVFELFARLHTEDEYAGNGIGLALSERIVNQLGGQIEVEDGIDGGSAFTFTLKGA
ncbi:MAG: ATP-binding protein, partial [Pseudomonadota bacterium]